MTNYLLYRNVTMMTPEIRTMESITIPTMIPILSPPVSLVGPLSVVVVVFVFVAVAVVVVVVVVVVAMKNYEK